MHCHQLSDYFQYTGSTSPWGWGGVSSCDHWGYNVMLCWVETGLTWYCGGYTGSRSHFTWGWSRVMSLEILSSDEAGWTYCGDTLDHDHTELMYGEVVWRQGGLDRNLLPAILYSFGGFWRIKDNGFNFVFYLYMLCISSHQILFFWSNVIKGLAHNR